MIRDISKEVAQVMRRAERLVEDLKRGDQLARREYWLRTGGPQVLQGQIKLQHQASETEYGLPLPPIYQDVLNSFAGPRAPYVPKRPIRDPFLPGTYPYSAQVE